MIKEFIERIGQVIRKMLGREKIKDATVCLFQDS